MIISQHSSHTPDGSAIAFERTLTAYSQTSHWVDAPDGPIRLRVGERSQALNSLLDSFGVKRWAFITASNPGSVRCSGEENGKRQMALVGRAHLLGFHTLPGRGIGENGDWPPEESLLILGIPREVARTLGAGFGQNAIIVGQYGEEAELLHCRSQG